MQLCLPSFLENTKPRHKVASPYRLLVAILICHMHTHIDNAEVQKLSKFAQGS